MGFLLAGIALLLSSLNLVEQGQRYVRALGAEPQLVFEHRTALHEPRATADRATIRRTGADHPVILSGFPAYHSVAFALPVDARPVSGYLQIDTTSQVLAGVEGVLRVSIHNARRGELLLRPGEAGRSLQIPLSPADFAKDQLVVSFSLQGTDPQQQCGAESGVAAVIEIEATSALFLTLDRPLATPRDQVRAAGNVASVAWPAWLKPSEQARRLVLATQLQRQGVTTTFAATNDATARDTAQLRALRDSHIPAPPEGNTLTLAQTGMNAGLRRFHRQTTWRHRYDLRDGPHRAVPAQLDLRMMFGRLMGGQHWALTVTLNSRMVFQGHVTGAQEAYTALIDLPADLHQARNVIEVTAVTTAPRDGICDDGPVLVAEMQGGTTLIPGDTAYRDALTTLRAALPADRAITIGTSTALTATDARIAADLLDRTLPRGAQIKPAAGRAQVIVLTPDVAAAPLPQDTPLWLVTQGSTGTDLVITPLDSATALPRTGLALLVAPGGLAKTGAAS
ncbi:MAG: cellulose biosynthesis cyclic di-GMP-binding regulatory protein BcsB [Pseudomonadota bacterium]